MSRISRLSIIFAGFGVVALAGSVACQRLPLLAPTGSVINLLLTSNVASLNSSLDLTAVIIEGGPSSGTGVGTGTGTPTATPGSGTPVQNGTTVSFTTTIGTIEPAEAKTQNGQVTVKFVTTGQSGTATITAYSGGAKSTLQVVVGAAAVDHVTVTASPANLPSGGGSTTVTAQADDVNGNALVGVPIQFNTTKGTLSPQTAVTNSNGVAISSLSTTAAADVTATSGAKTSAAFSVTLATRATLSLTGPATSVSVSTPTQFTVTAGPVALSNVTLSFGDGTTTPANSMAPAQVQPFQHFFDRDDIFNVKASGTDPDGVTTTAQLQVAVTKISATVSVPAPTAPSRTVTGTVTLGTNSTNAAIDHYSWDFGDGTPVTSFGNSQSHTYTAANTYTVKVTIFPSHGSAFTIETTVTVA